MNRVPAFVPNNNENGVHAEYFADLFCIIKKNVVFLQLIKIICTKYVLSIQFTKKQ